MLQRYRQTLQTQDAPFPPPIVGIPPDGLLASLPSPPAGRTGWPWTTQSPPSGKIARTAAPFTISVVVPSYRQGPYLEEALRSILLQNHPALQLIVIDGGSNDDSGAILSRYRPWLSFVRIGRDRGQAHAINLGLSLASGDIVGWLNSDDAYLPGALAAVEVEFTRNPRLEFLYGDGIYLEQHLNGRCYYSASSLALDRYLGFGGLIPSHAAFWRTVITEPLWENLHCNVDGELWFRLLRGRRRGHLPLPLGMLRGQPEAKSVDPRWAEAWHHDDTVIHAWHGRLSMPNYLLQREFPRVQRLYRWWIARRWRDRRRRFIDAANWQPDIP